MLKVVVYSAGESILSKWHSISKWPEIRENIFKKLERHKKNRLAKMWKQPKCVLPQILQFVATWMILEDVVLSEVSQSQKDKFCMNPFT